MKLNEFKFGELTIQGMTVGGVRTSFLEPQLKIAIDVALGFSQLITMNHIFITHGHLDHAAGIPYLISQRSMRKLPPAKYYLPKSIVEPLKVILTQWGEIEGFEYPYQFIPLEVGDEVNLSPKYFIRALKNYHRVPSLAYALIERKKKIKLEFQSFPSQKIAQLKKQNIEVDHVIETVQWVVSGDTTIEFLQECNEAKNAKTLFIETTFIDQVKSIEHARKWGHTHLDEVISLLPTLHNENIVLTHLSERYNERIVTKILEEKIPQEELKRFFVFAYQFN